MTEEVRATTVLLIGAMLVRLSLDGTYLRYVKAGMGPLLLVAGVLLVALGLLGVVRALAPGRLPAALAPQGGHSDDDDGHGHGHGHGESMRVAWLLLAPVVALLLVTPPALGSFGVDRGAAVTVATGGESFDPLPADGPVAMSLIEFMQRTADHQGASFGSTPVELTGFVADPGDGSGFLIARYQIACCAADAAAAVVRVTGAAGAPARDQWVTVTGTFRPSADGVPELAAASLVEIDAPTDPYE